MKKFLLGVSAFIAFAAHSAEARVTSEQEYCREFTQTINIDGRLQPAYGISCLQPDGSWKIQSLETDEDRSITAPVTTIETIRYVERPYYVYPRRTYWDVNFVYGNRHYHKHKYPSHRDRDRYRNWDRH